MNKKFIYTFCAVLFSLPLYSQELSGDWHGFYDYDSHRYKTSISLNIKWIEAECSYQIHSYTLIKNAWGRDSTLACIGVANKISKDSFLIEENRSLNTILGYSGFQKMRMQLKESRKYSKLKGRWESTDPDDKEYGDIYFVRYRQKL